VPHSCPTPPGSSVPPPHCHHAARRTRTATAHAPFAPPWEWWGYTHTPDITCHDLDGGPPYQLGGPHLPLHIPYRFHLHTLGFPTHTHIPTAPPPPPPHLGLLLPYHTQVTTHTTHTHTPPYLHLPTPATPYLTPLQPMPILTFPCFPSYLPSACTCLLPICPASPTHMEHCPRLPATPPPAPPTLPAPLDGLPLPCSSPPSPPHLPPPSLQVGCPAHHIYTIPGFKKYLVVCHACIVALYLWPLYTSAMPYHIHTPHTFSPLSFPHATPSACLPPACRVVHLHTTCHDCTLPVLCPVYSSSYILCLYVSPPPPPTFLACPTCPCLPTTCPLLHTPSCLPLPSACSLLPFPKPLPGFCRLPLPHLLVTPAVLTRLPGLHRYHTCLCCHYIVPALACLPAYTYPHNTFHTFFWDATATLPPPPHTYLTHHAAPLPHDTAYTFPYILPHICVLILTHIPCHLYIVAFIPHLGSCLCTAPLLLYCTTLPCCILFPVCTTRSIATCHCWHYLPGLNTLHSRLYPLPLPCLYYHS